jgi:hypothetical protein
MILLAKEALIVVDLAEEPVIVSGQIRDQISLGKAKVRGINEALMQGCRRNPIKEPDATKKIGTRAINVGCPER